MRKSFTICCLKVKTFQCRHNLGTRRCQLLFFLNLFVIDVEAAVATGVSVVVVVDVVVIGVVVVDVVVVVVVGPNC